MEPECGSGIAYGCIRNGSNDSKAIGYLRGIVEFLRKTKCCDRDSEGNPLLDHDVRIDITPEPLPAKTKGERPSSEKQEAEVMRLQQILNKMKKQEQKIYAIEKAIVKLEKDLKEVKKKWFHRKEQKELERKIETKKVQLEKAKATLDLIPAQHGYQNALELTKAMKLAKSELKKVQQAQKVWDAPEPELEKMYLRIPANLQSVEKRKVQKSTEQRRNIHERLEEKKQIVEHHPKKKKQIQIDIVGTPVEGKDYIIGSCKYRNEKIGVDELDLIRDYASVFGKGNNYHYYIFSKGGFTDGLLQAQERGEVHLITLEELYK